MSQPLTERPTRSTSGFINSMSPEERREHMRSIGARGNAERVTLSGEERQALSAAYDLIRGIAKRHGLGEGEANGHA